MGFCSKVLGSRVECDWSILNLIETFCIEFGVLYVTGFWSIEEVLNPKISIKEVMTKFVLIG